MKREAITHTKMKRLCRRLDIPTWQAVGLLESLWHLAARQTPRGDIGTLSDEDIALGIDYRGDEGALLQALAEAGWLDTDAEHRYLIHDWSEHADDAVQRKVARDLQYFADGRQPKLTRLNKNDRADAKALAFWEKRTECAQTDTPGAREREMGAQIAPPESGRTSGVLPEPLPSPSPEPRQSPASPEPGGAAAPERSSTSVGAAATSPNGTPLPAKADDDENLEFETPWDELKYLYARKTGDAPTIDVLETVEVNLLTTGAEISAFVAEIRNNHLAGNWQNPPGLLKKLSRDFRTRARKAAPPVTAQEAADRDYRCVICGSRKRGEGMKLVDKVWMACECATPEYVDKMREKGHLPPAPQAEPTGRTIHRVA